MSTDRAAEIIHRSYAAFRENDLEALLALYHPDSTWDMSHWDGWPDESVYEGREGMERILGTLRNAFSALDVRPEEIIDLDDGRVLVLGRMRIRGSISGAELDSPPFAQIAEVRDGLIFRVVAYSDAEAGRRAAGLAG